MQWLIVRFLVTSKLPRNTKNFKPTWLILTIHPIALSRFSVFNWDIILNRLLELLLENLVHIFKLNIFSRNNLSCNFISYWTLPLHYVCCFCSESRDSWVESKEDSLLSSVLTWHFRFRHFLTTVITCAILYIFWWQFWWVFLFSDLLIPFLPAMLNPRGRWCGPISERRN